MELKEEKLTDEIFAKIKSKGKVSIVVVGRNGVGKRTLIRTLFGEVFQKTGIATTDTPHIEKYSNENADIFVTKDFELENLDKVEKELDVFFKKKSTDSPKFLPIIWYCVEEGGILESEKELIKKMAFKAPTLLIVAQCIRPDLCADISDSIKKEIPQIKEILPVLAQDVINPVTSTTKAYGVGLLGDKTINCIIERLNEILVDGPKGPITWKKVIAILLGVTIVTTTVGSQVQHRTAIFR